MNVKKNGNKSAEKLVVNISKPLFKFTPATNYIDAYALLQHIAVYKNDTSRNMAATIHSLCVLIDKSKSVDWNVYADRYMVKYSCSKHTEITKIKMIKEFTELHSVFIRAVNQLGRRYATR